MDIKNSVSEATELLFKERKDFIIIGLTGRTGSGCTTVANLLCKTFEELSPPRSVQNSFNNNEERKYNIVYNYISANWCKFRKIEIKDIISSFILEYNLNSFISFLKTNFDFVNKESLIASVESEVEDYFNKLHEIRIDIKKRTMENEDKALKEDDIYEFYFNKLPNFTKIFKDILNSYNVNTYKEIYQVIANNIRTSGNPYETNFDPKNIFKLSERTNTLIKILRRRNLREKGRVMIVIDAFRNPYEATFFKDRYSAFYLFSINTDDEFIKNRLIKKGLTLQEIKKLDENEYPNNKKGIKIFSCQNIQKCIELSDVYLYNPDEGTNISRTLKKQLIKYICLIMHPGLVAPTHVERSMQIAYNAKSNSGCLSRKAGAVVTDENYSIRSVGWNCSAEGQIPCNLRDMRLLLNEEDEKAFSRFEFYNKDYLKFLKKVIKNKIHNNRLNGRLIPYCFKDAYNAFEQKNNQVHTRSLHAEENAFLQISKYGGTGLKNGYLFTTASPCELCSKKAYQIGIKKIYYIDPYPGISNEHIINCGENKPQMILFQGAIGRAYTQLYTAILDYKDELYMLLDFEYNAQEIESPAN